MQDKRILILLNDKDPIFSRVSKMKFEKEAGWETIITSSFEEALTQAKKNMPNVLLTEIIINDPNKTGFDLIHELEKIDTKNQTIIAVLTDLSQPEDKEKAKKLGADYYYVKTEISLIDLINHLKGLVSSMETRN